MATFREKLDLQSSKNLDDHIKTKATFRPTIYRAILQRQFQKGTLGTKNHLETMIIQHPSNTTGGRLIEIKSVGSNHILEAKEFTQPGNVCTEYVNQLNGMMKKDGITISSQWDGRKNTCAVFAEI